MFLLVSGVLRCSDTGSNVPVETLRDVPGLVLYALEIVDGEILLIFMQASWYQLYGFRRSRSIRTVVLLADTRFLFFVFWKGHTYCICSCLPTQLN